MAQSPLGRYGTTAMRGARRTHEDHAYYDAAVQMLSWLGIDVEPEYEGYLAETPPLQP